MPRWKKLSKWPHLLWLLLCVVIGGSLLAAVAAEHQRQTPFWHKYDQVQPDMTRQEVEKILGPPTDIWELSLAPMVLTWVEGEQQIKVSVMPVDLHREVVVGKEFFPKPLWEKVRDKVRGTD